MGAAEWGLNPAKEGGGEGKGLIGIVNLSLRVSRRVMGQREERQKEPSYRSHNVLVLLLLRAGGGQKQRDTGCGGEILGCGVWRVLVPHTPLSRAARSPAAAAREVSRRNDLRVAWQSLTLHLVLRSCEHEHWWPLCGYRPYLRGRHTRQTLPVPPGWRAGKPSHKTVNVRAPSPSRAVAEYRRSVMQAVSSVLI